MKKFSILIIGICSAMFCGCALQEDVVMLSNRIYQLEQHNRELQQRNEAVQKENVQFRSRLEEYSQNREEKDQSLRSQSAGLQAMSEKLNEDIRVLNGKIEETDHLLKRTIRGIQDSGKNQEIRLSRVEKQIKEMETRQVSQFRPAPDVREDYAPGRSVPDSTRGYEGTTPPPRSEEDFYVSSKQALDNNDFETARKGFRELLKYYPHSKHADNAQFWIGETFYREGQYEQAILEYQTVIERYPNGNKVRAALLKEGFAFFNIGDRITARQLLQDLVTRYPDSEEAKIAKNKLAGF